MTKTCLSGLVILAFGYIQQANAKNFLFFYKYKKGVKHEKKFYSIFIIFGYGK